MTTTTMTCEATQNKSAVTPKRIPLRKIVESGRESVLTKRNRVRGYIVAVVLECGHLADANRTERKKGSVHCFDCYYGKPAPYGDITEAE